MNYLNLFSKFFLRDFKIFLSYKFNILIQISFMIIFLLFIQFIIYEGNESLSIDNSDSLGYLIIGIALIDFMFACISVFSREVRNAQQYGTFEILFQLKTPIYIVIIASYSFTFFKTSIRVILYIILSSVLFGIQIHFSNIPIFIILLIFFSLPFIGIGLISASLIIIFKQGNIINLFVTMISIFLSGIFFPLDALPLQLQEFSEYNPLVNSAEIMANILIINDNAFSILELRKNIINITVMTLIFIPIGLVLVYYSLKASKFNGSLNHY